MTRRRREREGVLPTFNAVIRALGLAKDTCGIPPATVAFDSANALLTIIRVNSPLPYNDESLTRLRLGHHGQRDGLRRNRALLC